MGIWKDVFWACALLFVVRLRASPFTSAGTLSDVTRLMISGLSLIPLYGYAYQVPIGNRAVAIVMFGYNAIFTTIALRLAVHVRVTVWGLTILFLVLLLLALSFVFLYPQYKYAFDSDDLWGASA